MGNMDKLGQAMNALTIGTVKAMSRAQEQRALEGLMEREEQFKIAVSGVAEEFPGWSDPIEITFGTVFVDGTAHRDSPYDRPHFTHGAYIEEGGPVGLLGCIVEWITNDRNETLGCKLCIGPVATDVARTFKGEFHARFQGWGAPVDSYGDMSSIDAN